MRLLALIATLLTLAMFSQASSFAQEKQIPEVRELALGQSVERNITGGESHSYHVVLKQGEFLRAVANSAGIDIAVALYGPSQEKLLGVDLLKYPGPEPLSFVAKEAGQFRLEIRAEGQATIRGHYELTSQLKTTPDSTDTERLAAEQLLVEANDLERSGSKEALQMAIDKRAATLPIWRKLADRFWEAYSLHYSGRAAWRLDKNQQALEFYNQALAIRKEIGDLLGEWATITNLGNFYSGMRENQKALDYYNHALAIMHAVGNKSGEADLFNSIGLVYNDLGDKRKALDYYSQALSIYRALANKTGEANALDNLAVVYRGLGENQKALDYYNQAIVIKRALGDRTAEGDILIKAGNQYSDLGDQKKALDYYNQALAVYRALANKTGEATALNNIGAVYSDTGENQKALDYYNQALPIYHAIGGKSDEARTLSNLGIVYRNLKDKLKTAEYYGQALSLYRDLQDRVHEARTLRYLGDAYRDFGDTQKALEYYNQALPIYHALANVSDEASILNTIAYLYQSLDQRQKALDYLTQELPLWRSIGKKREEADTLFNIAIIYNDFGEKQKALDCLIQALPLRRATGDRDNETLTLYDLAFIHDDLGEEQKALEYATQALTLVRAGSKRDLEPDILNLLGIVHSNLGEHQKALDHYNQALPVARALGNRKTETSVLNNIGGLYDAMGDRQKALEYYNQALALERASNDRSGQANTLAAMGLTYYTLGETENALACLNQALEHDRAAGLREHEGRTLHNIGLVYSLLGDKQTAFKYYTQALAIERETHIDAGVTLIKIGEIYSIQGELEKALDFYNQALRDTRAFKNRRDEANALLNIGGLYSNLGEYRKALEYYNQALSLTRAIHDRDIEARAVRHIGSAHTNLGENQKAIEFLNQALSLERAASNRFGEVHTLNSLGISYFNLKDNQTALKYYNESLSLARAMGNRQLEALTLNNIGLVYASTDSQKALQYYGDALSLERIIGDRDGEALALGNLMDLWGELNNPGLAILYGKQAINIYQQFRSNISGFTREIQEVFLHSREESYRALIKLLLKMNRFAEAEQVLRMLKQEEYVSALTKRGSEEAEGLAKRADLTDKERAAISEYIKYGDEVSSIWQKYDAVQKELAPLKRKSQRTPEEDARLKALNDEDQQLGLQIENGKRVFEVFLRKLEDDFKTGSIERDPKPQLSERLVSDVAELSQRTGKTVVELHAVAGRDNVTLILTTPQGQEWYESKPAISSADLAELVLNFRDKLQSPTQDPRPLGQQLYRVLMPERLQHDLDVVKAQTIVWSLDGVLRYVPTAALWDGAHYLVERYENVEIALAIDSDIKEPSPEKLTGLGLGVSRAFEPEPGLKFPKLTNVPDELGAIIRDKRLSAITRKSGLLSGRALLDPDFTGDQLLAELKSGQYQVVHFATHFKFKPAAPDQSFLLLGDGTELTLDRLRFDARNTRVFQGVSLLTLSACETAVGEAAATGGRREKAGSEVEGLAVTAQNKGAKAVMATLWEVFTGSTGDLMEDFYRNWTTNRKQGKAAALRDAQLKMLYGNVPQADRDSERKEYAEWAAHAGDATRRAFKTDTRAPYAHPFYWSPFVLIGNWQ